ARDRHRNLHRADLFRHPSRVRHAEQTSGVAFARHAGCALALCPPRRTDRDRGGFIRGLSFAEDAFERIRNPYLRNFAGMLSIGVMIYAFMIGAGHYFVEGVGYSTVQAILTGGLDLPALLIILFAAKLAATSISLGAGSSGGIFSPSLFMGATLGAAF